MPKASRVKSRAAAVPIGVAAKSATPSPLATPSGSPQRPQKESPAHPTASSALAASSDKASKKERKLARRQDWLNKLSTASSRASSSAHDARVRGKPLLSLTTDWKSELKQLGSAASGATAQPTGASANGADVEQPPQKLKQQPVIKSRKAKQNQLKSEAARFQAVLNHAAFKADPFATIQTHLKNTLGSQQ
ncbi:ribosome biogenesis protein SLX9-domain-containing protein [Catenaria anguillulae PL171]|uniref:Ribosome biogenesis protein SLX9 n=1 Tax=Catenaria anguillulae PL171 TaxID=765915 RepID=A0A1Y2HJJ8_9FUNG|nr:ribosome biogenesis protein SLX9-domain-containing protein [Catenaria anguillulae PL171]